MIRTDSIKISPEILSLIGRIDELKGAWRAIGRLAPDRLIALRRVATIESVGSSTRIEGSKLSDRDVERLLLGLHIDSLASRDQQEVTGYAELMDLLFDSWPDIPVTENYIRQLHQVLLRSSEKDAWHRGHYKTSSSSVMAFDQGRITMGDAIKLTGASRNTLKQHFRSLVENGHLTRHGAGRGSWYQMR